MKPLLSAALVVVSALCLVWPAHAEKPDGHGHGRGKSDTHEKRQHKEPPRAHQKEHQKEHRGERNHNTREQRVGDVQIGVYFGAPQRQVLYDYYAPQFRAGKCPPGLAKKGNGCMPPGQARKWRVGQPLPRDVVYYPVPNEIAVRIGLPPPGYKYVRVAADILMIAVGTSMVIDAVDDLMR